MDLHGWLAVAVGWAGVATAIGAGLAVALFALRRTEESLKTAVAERDARLVDLDRLAETGRQRIQELEGTLRSEIERRSAAEAVSKRVGQLETLVQTLEGDKSAHARAAAQWQEKVGRLETELAAVRKGREELERQLQAVTSQREALQGEVSRLKEEAAKTATTLKAEQSSAAEKIALLQAAREELSASFKAIAGEILDKNSKRFAEQNQESLSALLNPLRERIKEFDAKVTSVYDKEARERFSLENEIKRLNEMHARMSQETENLTRALKGSAKTQGTWGELVLDQVLSNSGLRAGEEYVVQPSLQDADGHRLQPDVVVNLPEGKRLVVDSKVSLTAYERYTRASEDGEQATHLLEHLESIRRHVKGLADKNYHELYGIASPDFVLMFVAVESAFMLAMKEDPELFSWALKQNILLVCPSTLLATSRLIASIWRYEHQNRNAQEIGRLAGRLYDKFVGFVEDFSEVGKRIAAAQKTYEDARGKLATGKGNLVRTAENIKKLGVKPTKALPTQLIELAADENELPDEVEGGPAAMPSEAAS